MENQPSIISISFIILTFASSVLKADAAKLHSHEHGETKLFVFGDSYADTGNWPKSAASSWKEPYGITYPGKPSGRFSDGRVLTDYIASFLGIISPIPYERRKDVGEKSKQYGMNFAHGGTGVFTTLANQPNLTTQINFFQQEVDMNKNINLNSSVALVSVAGNDYGTFWVKNGTLQGLPSFTESLINQLGLNLKRIGELGVKKIAITALGPLGCLPQMTTSLSYQNCTQTENSIAKFHNELLQQTVSKLNNQSLDTKVIILDLYNAFLAAIHNLSGKASMEKTLKPCCIGKRSENWCGSIGRNGVKEYEVCENPNKSFFWDSIHPSQNGWFAVYSTLKSSLQPLL